MVETEGEESEGGSGPKPISMLGRRWRFALLGLTSVEELGELRFVPVGEGVPEEDEGCGFAKAL